METYGLVEKALVWILVFSSGAVEEPVAQGPVVDAAEPAAEVGARASEPLHAVVGSRTFWKKNDQLLSFSHRGCDDQLLQLTS